MNKSTILLPMILFLSYGSIFTMETKPSSKEHITDYIFRALKNSKPKNWCRYFPGKENLGGGDRKYKVCDPYFRLVLTKYISMGHGNQEYEITNDTEYNESYCTSLHLNEKIDREKKLNYFTTNITARGKRAIAHLDEYMQTSQEILKNSRNKMKDHAVSDRYTSCARRSVEDGDIPSVSYLCSTKMSYRDFYLRMNLNQD